MVRYKSIKETKEQTKTPEFKKWFGRSKVVDKSGNPLVVYHGTQGNFTQFVSRRNIIYFSSVKKNSAMYANSNNGSGKILEIFLSIQKPKIVYNIEDMRKAEKTAKKKGYDGIIAKGVKDGSHVSDVYIAFYPNQIKSATDNNGNFDPRSNNILEGIE